MTDPISEDLLDAEAWEAPRRLSEAEFHAQAGPDWRRAMDRNDREGDEG